MTRNGGKNTSGKASQAKGRQNVQLLGEERYTCQFGGHAMRAACTGQSDTSALIEMCS